MCCPDGTEEASAWKSRNVTKMVASRRSNIKGKGHYRRQRLDIWDGVAWDRRSRGEEGGGGPQPGSIGLSTKYGPHTLDVCWACFEHERERELVYGYVYNACVIASWGGLAC